MIKGESFEMLDNQILMYKMYVYFYLNIYQYLSYGEILAGQPEAWHVKCFICMKSHNFKKDLILKFKMIARTCFIFMIAFMVY